MSAAVQVLLVEDNPGDADLIREFLAGDGDFTFNIVHTSSLRKVPELVLETPPDVILLDLTLPDSSGLETLAHAVKAAPGAPIVVLTGLDDESLGVEAVKAGAQDYLMKGEVGAGALVRSIRYAIERKRAGDSIHQMAYYDNLTQLPNRTLFFDRLDYALAQTRRSNHMLAVLFLDLDRFKPINDMLGHAAGDRLLKEFSERLFRCTRSIDSVCRLGGDEFTVMLPEISRVEDVQTVIDKILAAMKPPFHLDGNELYLSASIGAGLYPADGTDAETLVRHADIAMYRAKQQGGRYQFYSSSMNLKAFDHQGQKNALQRAVEQGEFILYYQPRVSLKSGRITGAEALVRWKDSKGRIVGPKEFIPLAEVTGLILPLGELVLRKALTQAREWRASGLTQFRVGVNLSSRQFSHENLGRMVLRALDETGLDPGCLELELTESGIMSNPDAALRMLREFSEAGIHIAIDDFGTGYSSLSRLRSFPISTLKIDQSFIKDIRSGSDDAVIISAIIRMAGALRMRVVAEGVETAGQLAYLLEHGCDEAQGNFIGKPLPAAEFSKFLKWGLTRNMLHGIEQKSPFQVFSSHL